MPGLNFAGANLATVAYVEVSGVAGASTVTNSGVTTTRTALGTYVVILPSGLAQAASRDLTFVQAKGATTVVGAAPMVDDSQDATKIVKFWSCDPALAAATGVDVDFSFLVLRTTITPPTGAPA